MRLQSSQANCGSTALHNAACALGRTVSMEECERACRVDATDGTDQRRLAAGARAMGFKVPTEIRESRDDVAVLLLKEFLDSGYAAILLVDNEDNGESHWVAAIGRLGPRFLIADSADSELVVALSPPDLVERWEGEGRRKFYALIVGVVA